MIFSQGNRLLVGSKRRTRNTADCRPSDSSPATSDLALGLREGVGIQHQRLLTNRRPVPARSARSSAGILDPSKQIYLLPSQWKTKGTPNGQKKTHSGEGRVPLFLGGGLERELRGKKMRRKQNMVVSCVEKQLEIALSKKMGVREATPKSNLASPQNVRLGPSWSE